MTEKIKLSSEEYDAACSAAHDAVIAGWKDSMVVEKVIRAVNNIRVGDPVLTIRRRWGSDLHALRVKHGWITFTPEGTTSRFYAGAVPDATWSGTHIADWPLVYSPEGDE